MRDKEEKFEAVADEDMRRVSGGTATIAANSTTGSDQLTAMLTQITQSIQALAQKNNGGIDQTTLMLMMMMMMGGGGGGGGFGGPPFGPTFVRVNTDFPYGGGGWGWGGGGCCGCCGIC